MSEILITGATGNVGGDLAKIFERERLPVVAAVSNPEKARSKLPANAELRRFDFKDIKTYGDVLNAFPKFF